MNIEPTELLAEVKSMSQVAFINGQYQEAFNLVIEAIKLDSEWRGFNY